MRRKLICTSDWHVARGAWRHKGVLGDSWFALEQLIDFAIANDAVILAAGDLYDAGDPDPDSVAFVHRQCDRLEKANVPLLYTVGQHERRRSDSTWIGTHRWPTHVGGGERMFVPMAKGALYVQGFDWTPASRIPDLLSRVDPDADILMLHQVAKEVMEGSPGGYEISLADVPGSADIVIGDYHDSKKLAVGDHLVLSAGSMALQSIDENPNKGFWVMDRDGSGEMGLDWVGIASRPVVAFRIDRAEELDRFLAARPWRDVLDRPGLPPWLTRPLVRVTFDDSIPGAAARITEALGSDSHLFLNPIRRSDEAELPATATSADSLEAALREMTEPGDPARDLLIELLRADRADVPKALVDSREQFVASRAWDRTAATATTSPITWVD